MEREFKYIVTRCLVLPVAGLYLFVALSHIFFLSNTTLARTDAIQLTINSKLKNGRTANYVQRTDKAVFKENKKEFQSDLPPLSLNYHFSEKHIPVYSTWHFAGWLLFYDRRYTYLLFLVLRI